MTGQTMKEKRYTSGKPKLLIKMVVVYTLVLLIPLLSVGGILLSYATQVLHGHYLEVVEADNRRVRTVLSSLVDQIFELSDEVCFRSDVKTVLKTEYPSIRDYISAVNQITELDHMEFSQEYIEGIYIYTDNPTLKTYKQFCLVDGDVLQQKWYHRALEKSNAFWTCIMNETYTSAMDNLCLVRQISLLDSAYHAVLVIRLSDAYIRGLVTSGTNLDTVVLEGEGIIYGSRTEWYGKSEPVPVDTQQDYYRYSGVAQLDGVDHFTAISTIKNQKSNTRLYVYTMNSDGFAIAADVARSGKTLLTIAIFVPFLILVLFAGYFSRRVQDLRGAMRKAKGQDYNMSPGFRGNDEITEIYGDLVSMVQEIKEKDARMFRFELQDSELRSKQEIMEYKVLASQINPHYLYNALETIRMKALSGGDREVADAIKILGKTLHYVMENTGTAYTTLARELEHVNNYLSIQKLRFGDRIEYELELGEAVDPQELTMLPLLLQPVVENAVVHGLESMDGTGHIRVVVQLADEKLRIKVCDSGKGIAPEALKQLQQALEDMDMKIGSGIALRNIHRRIRLSCGEGYGLRLESEPKIGTRVILELPVRKG